MASNIPDNQPDEMFGIGVASVSLNVGIVGAGIAGLTAATALRQSGHHVERAKAVIVEQCHFMKGDTLETIDCADCRDMVDKYGWPWHLLHRVDLHTELRRLVGEADYKRLASDEDHRETEPTRINLAAKVIEVNCELGTLKMANGSVVYKDLIVAADGVHSSLSSTVIGTDSVATPTGSSMFRFLVPTEKLVQRAETRSLVQGAPRGVNLATGPDRRIVWYPCRNGELQNFGLIHPDTRTDKRETDWRSNASLTELIEECKGFHSSLRAAIGMAEDIKLWKLLYRPPISSWTRGKVILIGDAAHPMLPNQGQGGAQAIEDGAALGLLLSNLPDVGEVPRRLKLFQEIRNPRVAAMQIFSNAGQDEAEKIQREARAYVKGPIPKTPAEFREWKFSYDIFQDCAKALVNLDSQARDVQACDPFVLQQLPSARNVEV